MAARPDEGAADNTAPSTEGPGQASVPAGTDRRWPRRLLIGLSVTVALICLWGLLGKFLLPGLLRDTIAEQLGELSQRPARVERVEIQPYRMLVRIHGLQVGEQQAGNPQAGGSTARSHARLEMLEADLSWRTFRRLAPVLDRLLVVRPDVLVARGADGIYDGADIVERLSAPKPDEPPSEEPPRFSVANIQLIGGRVRLDDRKLDVSHEASDIDLRVPFVSSLPVDQQIEVVPGLDLMIDGAPVRAHGRMLPFAEERTGEVVLSLDAFDLTRLLPHLPEGLPVKLVSAGLSGNLTTTFVAPASAPPKVTVRGQAALGGVELRQPDDRALLKLADFDANGIEFEPLESRLAVETLRFREPQISIERRADEARLFEPMLRVLDKYAAKTPASAPVRSAAQPPATGEAPAAAQATAPAASRPPFAWSVSTIAVDDGKLDFVDRHFEPKPLQVTLSGLNLRAAGLASSQSSPARIEASASANNGEQFAVSANVVLAPLTVDGEASLAAVPLARWIWLAGPGLRLEIPEGQLAASIRFQAGEKAVAEATSSAPAQWKLSDGKAKLDGLRALDGKNEVARVASIAANGIIVDPRAQRVTVGSVALDGGTFELHRDADGQFDAARWWATGNGAKDGAAKDGAAKDDTAKVDAAKDDAAKDDAAKDRDAGWQVSVGKIAVAKTDLTLGYAAVSGERFEPLALTGIDIEASAWATDSQEPLPVRLAASVAGEGRLEVSGSVASTPFAADLALKAQSLPLAAAQPWMPPRVNARVRSGAVSADGKLKLGTGGGGALQGGWNGAVSVADLRARLKRESAAARAERRQGDLLGWKSLKLASLKVALAPFSVDVGDVALDGLRSRLVINPQGRFNLQDVFGDEGENAGSDGQDRPPAGQEGAQAAGSSGTAAAAGAVPPADDGPGMGGADQAQAPASPPPKADAPPVRIGRITLTDANIDFSDFFIQPNYSANLTGVAGTIGAMRPGEPGEIELNGKVDNTGAVEVAGRIDPIGKPLFLDVRADARDIDLPALSPYSAKYVGYGIEKGKLSASVEYRVVNGQLTAQNQIVLDQLTFGEHVDSPDALKLPVLFAVSLLKDRNGVIDVRLPVSGSLDDPQFSIGGIVLRIIGNLIVKAVTAPFSLIAGLVGGGGGGEELSWLPFAAADSRLGDEAKERLGSLAKALGERPGLKVDIGGRTTSADQDLLRRRELDKRLAAIKRELGGSGRPSRIADEERPALLEQAWLMGRDPRPPPDKRPPAQQMEAELLEGAVLPDAALRDLANRRAQAAKDWLANEGKIDAARLFLTSSSHAKPDKAAATDKAAAADDVGAKAEAVEADKAGVAGKSGAAGNSGAAGRSAADAGVELKLK